MSGEWTGSGQTTYTWESISGQATRMHIGNTSWTGQFGDTVPFKFTTDDSGSGSWHINLRDSDFPDSGSSYTLSVWINKGGTILISDNFTVVVD